MTINLTLRNRLILTFALLSAAIAVTLGAFALILMEVSEEKLIDKTVTREAHMLAGLLAEFPGSVSRDGENFIVYIMGPKRRDTLPDAVRRLGKPSGEVAMNGKMYRLIHVQESPYEFYFLFDFSHYEVFETAAELAMLIAVCFAVLFGLWLGIATSRKVLNPIVRLADMFEHENNDDAGLAELPGDFADDEVGLLADKFSQYNKKIKSFIAREKAFAANASHELRNPIFAIAGAAEVLENSPSLSADDRRTVSRIRQEANAMREKVDFFLVLARGAEQSVAGDEIDVVSVVENQLNTLRPVCEKKGIELSLTLNDKPVVRGSRQAFLIILRNLLNNAVEYTRKGRIAVTVGAGSLVIEDTGLGISQEIKEKVFERFFREHHPEINMAGTGIGLSLVRELCNLCNWRISLQEPQHGTGTRVVFDWS